MSRMTDTSSAEQSGSVGQQMRENAAQLQQNLREMGSQVRDAASEKIGQLRDRASEYYEQGRRRAAEWEQNLESYVQEKPIQSLLIAAGVGMLLGIFWRRR